MPSFSPNRRAVRPPVLLSVAPDRIGCDAAITPEALRRINWTMVSAILLYWDPRDKLAHHMHPVPTIKRVGNSYIG